MTIQKLSCTDSKIEALRKINAMADAIGHGMPIGTIFQAIRKDIPEGSLRLDGSEYTTGFTNFVQKYLATEKVICKSYEEWQTEYTMTNGNVGFFAYNSSTGAFKVPCIQDGSFLAQAVTSGQFGSFFNSEIKSHTHSVNITTSSNGAHTHKVTVPQSVGSGGNLASTSLTDDIGDKDITFTTQSSGAHTHTVEGNTSAIGGEDTYPKHLRYPFFVVVANTEAEEASQADWDNFVGNLDTKADKSLVETELETKVNKDDMVNAGSYISGCAMPNFKVKTLLTAGATGTSYTAPASGVFHCLGQSTAVGGEMVFGVAELSTGVAGGSNFYRDTAYKSGQFLTSFANVKKGDKVQLYYTNTTIQQLQFIYTEGEVE